jgi:hypothetical protein
MVSRLAQSDGTTSLAMDLLLSFLDLYTFQWVIL